jgi:hypothetical protein
MQIRSATRWLIFKDEGGRITQQNSGTADAGEAA